ncbi:hypothetical protein ADK67_33655 [Saccharothrix sp. NRRL B-16348]|uniref:hypothetical protein n=1 Tax=Saccharothrix sp. NRRL B-16348 TaxID=1415542 RepID=UPI0006AE5B37|nr:hypothetical protein [Saccharothrix sp. NRRL B-16348]KOX19365.1 hypothetical protein ADK67_33655 [Saccharothrix sp. NRRL B-16348]
MTAERVVVSIEEEGAPRAGGSRVATGWLVEPTRVVVPDPPPGLLDGSLAVAIVLAGEDESPIERIPMAGVNAVRLAGAEFAVLDLATASRHAPNAVMPEPVVLEAAIAAHGGDVRAAFEATGGPVPPGDRACAKHNIVNCARCP